MTVKYELEGDVAVITLNRPDSFNAITAELAAGLVAALSRAGQEARVLILTGSGKAFCAGADLGEISEGYKENGPNLGSVLDNHFHPAVNALVEVSVPTVGAINGVAAGAGLGLALACDIRLMSGDAFLMSAFAGIGLAPDSGTTWWLPHHVGVSKALEITLTNSRVHAAEAARLGLALEVVDPSELKNAALSHARRLTDMVPESLVATRHLIHAASGKSFSESLAAERDAQQRLGRSAEHAEGVAAFLEKRKPDYRNPSG